MEGRERGAESSIQHGISLPRSTDGRAGIGDWRQETGGSERDWRKDEREDLGTFHPLVPSPFEDRPSGA